MVLRRLLVSGALVWAPKEVAAQPLPQPAFCSAPDTAAVLVHLFDVGQGDAILLRTSDARTVLVDAGPSATTVLDQLRTARITRLDLLVLSHYHHDHIGGAPAVLASLAVANVLENGVPATTQSAARTLAGVERSGARVLRAEARTLTLGDLALRVLPPAPSASTQNQASVGVIAQYGAFSMLLSGDAETPTLEWWARTGAFAPVTVVKVPHHGARNGTTRSLVAQTRPTLAMVSVGRTNRYGHPAPSVLAEWAAGARHVLRTDTEGTIAVRGCRDGSIRVRTARGAHFSGAAR
jgi:competence protein ComEC